MERRDGYEMETEDRGEYIWVLTRGPQLTAEISMAYWDEIAEICDERHSKKILIEKDFPESVGPRDMVAMAEHLGNILPGFKIAFHDRHGHDAINELGKKLARNRDVMMQVFDDPREAEKWLKAN
jgi:hypothetical protein